ncbi:MAG TPA: hypothetical protein VIY29_23530 [Ktedonobacteraceae bacterium]
MNIQDHKALKSLKKENIRDHMTDLELILTMLGEATATRLHQDRDTQGFDKLQVDAREAGDVAGNTRRDIEQRTDTDVVSPTNYLHLTGSKKNPKRLKEDLQGTTKNKEEK